MPTPLPPKKSLGQHFLLNPSTLQTILEKAGVQSTDQILEIGPGPGRMTEMLAAKGAKVIAVEKDRRFAEKLRGQFENQANLTLLEGDILKLNIEEILETRGGKWKVVANLPYNIATEVIFRLLASRLLFHSFYFMVQQEVAERLVAKAGSKSYGVLSIFSKLFSENRLVMRLPPGAFTPPPKVHSALVEFKIQEECRFPIDHLPTFKVIVRTTFGGRRKMIRNTLKKGLPTLSEEKLLGVLSTAGIPPESRPEEISPEKFAELSNLTFPLL